MRLLKLLKIKILKLTKSVLQNKKVKLYLSFQLLIKKNQTLLTTKKLLNQSLKLQDIADDIAEKIEKLTKVADKDKADATEKAKAVEEKNAALDKQKETLEKAKTALETAKKNKAEQAIQDGLQEAVTKLEAAVATAKTAADEAQAKFDEVNEAVKAYKDAIDELTDDYNATLGYIENKRSS